LTTYFLTSSFFLRANTFLIVEALFGPSLLGLSASVIPGISASPFLTIVRAITERSGPVMHPLTDFLLRSPALLGL
jgi:hypothetical protein